ncbi:MAG: metal ABC transporter permease [Victivallaceae bacterium]|nr:metal ABC transporter permease [Victivallaceae bacterium]
MIDFLHTLASPEMFFLRCAMIFGLLSSVTVGIIGTMVVTRRISSIAGAVSHAALGGVGAALFLQRVCQLEWCSPMLGAVAGAVATALLIGCVNLFGREREDTVIAVMWAMGMSVGLLFLDRTPGYVDWQGYLFGNILLLTEQDLWMTLLLDAVVLIPTILFYNQILAMSFDGTFAELRGVRVRVIYLALLAMTALAIVLLINVVGIILVIALLTLPAATAGCFTRHLWSMMALGSVLSWLFVTGGLAFSYCYRLPSGPAITLVAAVVYVGGLGFAAWRGRRNR